MYHYILLFYFYGMCTVCKACLPRYPTRFWLLCVCVRPFLIGRIAGLVTVTLNVTNITFSLCKRFRNIQLLVLYGVHNCIVYTYFVALSDSSPMEILPPRFKIPETPPCRTVFFLCVVLRR